MTDERSTQIEIIDFRIAYNKSSLMSRVANVNTEQDYLRST